MMWFEKLTSFPEKSRQQVHENFAIVNGQTGQSANNQIDCLADLGAALGNNANRLWSMENGYALASHSGLIEISHQLQSATARLIHQFND
jgi:hypothetical protein